MYMYTCVIVNMHRVYKDTLDIIVTVCVIIIEHFCLQVSAFNMSEEECFYSELLP